MAVGVTRSQRKSKSEALRRLTLSAAKQRVVDSDDSAEESMVDVPGNTSEVDEDDSAGPEMLASNPKTSIDTEPAVDRMSHSPSATEISVQKGIYIVPAVRIGTYIGSEICSISSMQTSCPAVICFIIM